ncbi:MAG TPA: EAL domain-containing protein [Cellulomonas sp.]|uniref:putative bifunctional diguanylate cyclase/phosphodiesterase n=1 Tax=Cellulomonas sp. TaxID=40001 RepID=UPI002E3059AA|nr:EAL domain-containing protein [Cellulomonas sp.]HEX5332754.1 EAL domain-containing protein [Cellulomonas sp.]
MDGTVAMWAAALHFLAAGLVGGFCVLEWLWWRGELRVAGAAWTLAWSGIVGLGFAASGTLILTPVGPVRAGLMFVGALLGAGAVVVALPATRAYTSGPRVRWYVVAAGAVLTLRAALWFGTDLVVRDPPGSMMSGPGPLDGPLVVLAVAVVITYVAVAAGSARVSGIGLLLLASAALSVVTLVAGFLIEPGSQVSLLTALWPLPLGVGLELLALHRLRGTQRAARLEHLMRDATARISNAAWFLTDPEVLLVRARDESRVLLDDPSIEGSLRPLPRHRFVAELYSRDGRSVTTRERVFLMDLAFVVSAVAERQELASRLGRAAATDALTRLPNRHALDEQLRSILERADVERTRVGLVHCDVDGFKKANDRNGHAWGDAVLVQVADHLRSVVDGECIVARTGGDEFVVVVPRAGHDQSLVQLGRHIRDGLAGRGPAGRGPEQVAPVLNVGVASWTPGAPIDPDALLTNADTATREAQRTNAGVTLFDRALRTRVLTDARLLESLEQGVGLGEFASHFQPIVDARTLEVVELEALARWTHGGRTLLPGEWLLRAEQSGLIVPIGRALLESSRAGFDRFALPVAVNIAARQLAEPDFIEHLEQAWGDSDWDQLTVEVTESALFDDRADARAKLVELRARGVRISLDDFGTGYSSLSRLALLPVDVLKIDQSFVREIGTERGLAVLRAILALAEAHGLDVIAEGVERVSELTGLVELGVTRVQGNLLGRPSASLPVRFPQARPPATATERRKHGPTRTTTRSGESSGAPTGSTETVAVRPAASV